MSTDRLPPRARAIYAVRWLSAGRGDIKHRHFTRRHDAEVYAARLRRYGKVCAVFRAELSEWKVAA